ncbi:MAG TPA: glycosyltransferase [Bacteroidales bacterium]|nr:glycosyltransferase [Bacteroidales bacterium]
MKLSIVIVNYNVRYFLEQCLHSVQDACRGLDTEVFVVDNASVDGSSRMVRDKFPDVILIENKENRGFSAANNQAITRASGEYILLLNPDTIVEQDTLSKVVSFMDNHPDAGGLGVKMLDGKGKFLPESKRGLPLPSVAFFKVFGFSALFPKSRVFSRYHLGHLDKDETHVVDVLSGAFMVVRKTVFDRIGLLDEDFFMYGEDIDLSYRITQSGFRNYYFPGTRIIHYKGESTKKGSLNYVFMFYNAMIVFARKHFSRGNIRAFSAMINIAIYFRAAISIFNRFFGRIIMPMADALMTFAGILLIKNYWESHFIFPGGCHYPYAFVHYVLPIYIATWLACVYVAGGYDRPVRLRRIIQGMAAGTLIILVGYSLLNESYRFSRALIILGAVWGTLIMLLARLLLHLLDIKGYRLNNGNHKRFVIVGEKNESERVSELLQQTGMNPAFTGLVSYHHHRLNANGFIGHLGQIREIITIHRINEVIFCSKDVPAQVIIDQMSELQDMQVDFKIAPPESLSIIGSNSINTSGDLYVIDINAIVKRTNRRAKRMFDLVASLALLISFPVTAFFVAKPAVFLRNIFTVIVGWKSWIGFTSTIDHDTGRLPRIRKGVLNPLDAFGKQQIPEGTASRLDILYARDYRITNDLNIMIKGFRKLGRGQYLLF